MTRSSKKRYFDLHTNGVGYLNRIRDVKPEKGDSYLACDIAALHGDADKPDYCRFDARVSGVEAQHLVRRCEQAVKDQRKVLMGFRIGDLSPEIFTHTKGKKAGQQGISLKSRLLFVNWIKVDREMVYKADPKPTDESNDPSISDAEIADIHRRAEAVFEARSASDVGCEFDDPIETPALAEAF